LQAALLFVQSRIQAAATQVATDLASAVEDEPPAHFPVELTRAAFSTLNNLVLSAGNSNDQANPSFDSIESARNMRYCISQFTSHA